MRRNMRFGARRKQNLATIADIENYFKRKNEKGEIIGKPHEKGATFEKFVEDVCDYVSVEYDEGDDLDLLLEELVDDFEQSAEITIPKLTEEDEERKKMTYMFQQDYAMYRKRGKVCKAN